MEKNFLKIGIVRWLQYFLIFSVILVIAGCTRERQFEGKDVGTDRFTFRTAEEMYNNTKILNDDSKSKKLVQQISDYIKSGYSEVDFYIWDDLNELNPYRKNITVQLAIQKWAKTLSKKIKTSNGISYTLYEANSNYKDSDFYKASNRYIDAIREFPDFLDARNNLALSEMHCNKDVNALLELEIIRNSDTSYIPAIINLTVLYERLGLSNKADSMARMIYKLRKDIPIASYNAAWFLNKNKDYAASNKILEKNHESVSDNNKISTKYGSLYALNIVQASGKLGVTHGYYLYGANTELLQLAYKKSLFLKVGMVGKFLNSSPKLVILASVIFIILTIVLIIIIRKSLDVSYYTERKGKGFLILLLAGSVIYILYWGLPAGGYWIVFGIYLLISGLFTAR
jgi:tetratricopeptide (TPR) repeat protein